MKKIIILILLAICLLPNLALAAENVDVTAPVQGTDAKFVWDFGSGMRLMGAPNMESQMTLKPWNFLSFFINFMEKRGVPLNSIYLILVLPVIATIVAFSRQIVGIKSLGIYTPSLIAIAFLMTGLKYGLVIFVFTLIIAIIGRFFASKIRLSYLPRVAIVLTLTSLSILFFFLIGATFDKDGLMGLTVFPILIMVLMTEEFINIQAERGTKPALVLTAATLLLAVVCFVVTSAQIFINVILKYPELILLTLILNILIGRWTGLRLTEYYRFRKVIQNVELAQKK